jgi:hypothetical protein
MGAGHIRFLLIFLDPWRILKQSGKHFFFGRFRIGDSSGGGAVSLSRIFFLSVVEVIGSKTGPKSVAGLCSVECDSV